jgi:cytochrome c-type biogenesis protein CcmH/NrfG
MPQDDQAMVNLGAAYFNLGKTDEAQKQFIAATKVNPKNAEAFYDLGFLYLSASKPDMAKAKAAWATVVAIDPKSEIAKNVQTHLQGIASASASPAPSK